MPKTRKDWKRLLNVYQWMLFWLTLAIVIGILMSLYWIGMILVVHIVTSLGLWTSGLVSVLLTFFLGGLIAFRSVPDMGVDDE